MSDAAPIIGWHDGDLLVELWPHRDDSPWCLALIISRPSTGEAAAFEWSARYPDLLVQAPPDRRAPADPTLPLLVTHSQGIGDFVQQLRYLKAPELKGRTVMLECPPELVALVEAQDLAVELVEPGTRRGSSTVNEVSNMRLDQWLKDPAGKQAYLRAPKARRRRPAERLRVGLNWSGKLGTIGVESKSVPLSDVQALVEARPEIDWVSVQWGPSELELRDRPWACSIDPRGKTIDTVARLANELAELDLLISIDSGPAHLAGALGVPVWTLLSQACGWRWRLDRSSSHLYGSMTLFRFGDFGAWSGLIERVGAQLDDWVAGGRQPIADAGANGLAGGAGTVPARFADDPIGTCRSLGLAVDSRDSGALACIFQLLVTCYGGFSWCQPEPQPAPALFVPAAFAGNRGFAELVAGMTQV
ncbi:MAG: hypothetical protein AAFX39_04080 [Pseudomonadota bacterium]